MSNGFNQFSGKKNYVTFVTSTLSLNCDKRFKNVIIENISCDLSFLILLEYIKKPDSFLVFRGHRKSLVA